MPGTAVDAAGRIIFAARTCRPNAVFHSRLTKDRVAHPCIGIGLRPHRQILPILIASRRFSKYRRQCGGILGAIAAFRERAASGNWNSGVWIQCAEFFSPDQGSTISAVPVLFPPWTDGSQHH